MKTSYSKYILNLGAKTRDFIINTSLAFFDLFKSEEEKLREDYEFKSKLKKYLTDVRTGVRKDEGDDFLTKL